ncbi:MAG: entericidin A/B family lipoprotein [Boseongicola sp.]|nr:MAG: entericidin A/B family lipoprotein [Boseongicola sp.]
MKHLILLSAVLFGLTACNTIDGMGRDVSAGAQAMDRAF